MIFKKQLQITSLALLCMAMASCSAWNRMGMGGKVAVLAGAGAAGAVAGGGGATVAAGLGTSAVVGLSAITASIINQQTATMEQKTTALRIAQMAEANMDPEVRNSLLEADSPVISVKTTASSNQRGQASIMLYNLEENRLVDDQVREVRVAPETGTMVQFDTVFTQYVGDGTSPEEESSPSEDESEDSN